MRAQGQPQGRNSPTELPRIASVLAELRGLSLTALAQATSDNARRALGLPPSAPSHQP
jgi:TatD DNase family protein